LHHMNEILETLDGHELALGDVGAQPINHS
jgi:hypothetical protein